MLAFLGMLMHRLIHETCLASVSILPVDDNFGIHSHVRTNCGTDEVFVAVASRQRSRAHHTTSAEVTIH